MLSELLMRGLLCILLLHICTATPASREDCPNKCQCENQSFICDSANLTAIPILPDDTAHIRIWNSQIVRLVAYYFDDLPDLVSVDLSANNISDIDDEAFPVSNKISSLILNSNKLTAIGRNTFMRLRNLQILSLHGNRIASIDANAFESLPNNLRLNLGSNNLTCSCQLIRLQETGQERNWSIDGSCTLQTKVVIALSSVQVHRYLCEIQTSSIFRPLVTTLFPSTANRALSELPLTTPSGLNCVTKITNESQACHTLNSYCQTTLTLMVNRNVKQLKDITGNCEDNCTESFICDEQKKGANDCFKTYCCQGNLCNTDKFVAKNTDQNFTWYPAPAFSGIRLVIITSIEEPLMQQIVQNILKQYDVKLTEYKIDLNGCVYNNSGGETQCFYYLDVNAKSGEQPSFNLLKELLINSSAPQLKGIKVFSESDANCELQPILSLGQNKTEECKWKWKGQKVEYVSYCKAGVEAAFLTDEDPTVCPSKHTEALDSILRAINNKTASEAMRNVSEITETSEESLTSSDVVLVSDVIAKALSVSTPKKEDRGKYMVTFNAIQDSAEVNLLTANEKNRSVEQLLRNIELFTEKMDLDGERVTTLEEPSLVIQVVDMTLLTTFGYNFQYNDSSVKVKGEESVSVDIPTDIRSKVNRSSENRLSFIIYKSGNLFKAMNRDSKQQQLGSWVISASVGESAIKGLNTPVKIRIPHRNAPNENQTLVCKYWDWANSSWSSDGLVTKYTGSNYTECTSTHLTNFALLLDLNPYDSVGAVVSSEQLAVLSYVSYAGCAISLAGLIVTIVTYAIHRKLRKDNPSKILINLCVALGLLNLVFVSLTHFKDDYYVCKITAVLLHFSLIASFSWMAIEAFYMYIALVLVFSYIKRFMLKVMLIGWGIPTAIVVITLSINVENYQQVQGQLCWLQPQAFFGAVLAPIALILCVNIVAFIMVIKQLYTVQRRKLTADSTREKHRNISTQIRGAIAIFILLGLTWTMAGFLLIQKTIVFNYLFAIFNSLQGFFLFIFYCVLKRDAQLAWMRTCPCFEYEGGYSSTSGNRITNGSMQTLKTRQSQSTSQGRTDSTNLQSTGSIYESGMVKRASLGQPLMPYKW